MRKQLKLLEEMFLRTYPEGFNDPELEKMRKKHKVSKMQDLVRESFSRDQFKDTKALLASYEEVVSKSSLVSVFEKVAFKKVMAALEQPEQEDLKDGLYNFLYGDQEAGFTGIVEVLRPYKVAKWPIITIVGLYFAPDDEVLVKPTTAKAILSYFDVKDLTYKPLPSYDFYDGYRKLIREIKGQAFPSLQVNNAAFCGFLMMTIPKK